MNALPILVCTTAIMLGTAVPVRAQSRISGVGLNVCNKGAIPVEVGAAERNDPVLGVGKLYWNIRGKSVAPGTCASVYGSTAGLPAYIGFGFYDALGQWGSGKIHTGVQAGAQVTEVETVCSDVEEHRRRIETRGSEVPRLVLPSWEAVIRRDYHLWDRDHLTIDTAHRSLASCVSLILAAI